MKLKAYAKINLILNVLGTRPDGYHEVEMLMQAISLCDVVTVGPERLHWNSVAGSESFSAADPASCRALSPADFEYGEADLMWKAALLMAQEFRPELLCRIKDQNACSKAELPGIRGVRISVEKHIPAAAGLAGGSADAAAVMIGLAKLWGLPQGAAPAASTSAPAVGVSSAEVVPSDRASSADDALLALLLPLAARLGSDVPFCLASQLGHPAAIATGTGTTLEYVKPLVSGVTLYFSDRTIPDKTRAVYAELKDEDCAPRHDIRAFLAAKTLKEKRALAGNHLQAPAERLMKRHGIVPAAQPGAPAAPRAPRPLLCGAGPTYFSLGKTGSFRTVTK